MTVYVVRVLFQVLGSYYKGHKAAMSPLTGLWQAFSQRFVGCFLPPSCLLQPPTSRFDSLSGLFLLSWHLHPSPCSSTLPPRLGHTPPPRPSHVTQHPTSPTTHWVFFTTLLHSTTPNESIWLVGWSFSPPLVPPPSHLVAVKRYALSKTQNIYIDKIQRIYTTHKSKIN